MSISSQRILAAAAAAAIAALTGTGIAVLSATTTCEAAPRQAEQTQLTPTAEVPGRINDAPPPTSTAPPTTLVECTPSGWAATAPAILGAGGAATAAIVVAGLLLLGRRRPTGPPPDPTGPHPDDPDRETLITACIYVRDRITSRALGDRLATALTAAGVGILEPVGARFDPALHEAGGTVTTTDPARAGTIAAVESPGYTDRTGRLLRAPVVTVHRLSDPARGESR